MSRSMLFIGHVVYIRIKRTLNETNDKPKFGNDMQFKFIKFHLRGLGHSIFCRHILYTMLLSLTAASNHLFLVALSALIPAITNECMPTERCTETRDSHSKCCTELPINAASTFPAFVEMVTEKSKTITTTHRRPIPTTTTLRKAHVSLKVNTTVISCGRQMLDNNKIVGGSETKFGEFPWMAVLFYSKYNLNLCAGSVIQTKFILTAAHCLVGPALSIIGKPHKVRLGEYDLTTDPDCMAYNFCAPNSIDIAISGTFPHPKYPSKARSGFDIGLIKLVDEIVYSNYIQPICFDGNVNFVDEWFYVAGWGKTEKAEISNRLLKAVIPYANMTVCQQAYNSINIRDDQICAGGINGIDSCSGDSGAPLMLLKNGIWSVVGVVSKGHSKCGLNKYPALYTRIDLHLKWLQRKMLSA